MYSVVSNSLWPCGLWTARLLCPLNFPDKNTRVDCHFLHQSYVSCVSCTGRWILYHHTTIPLLLLLLSHVSHVQLCVTPLTAAHQAPPSLGFSRQEHWSGLPFPPPMHENEKWKWSRQSCPTLSDPMDCSLPGSSVHGIFQARVTIPLPYLNSD